MALKIRPDQQRSGPWLDRLFPVHLPGGRMLSVSAFSVLPTNLGIGEGGLEPRANGVQREKMLELARKRFGDPVVELPPRIEPLPEFSEPRRPRERLPWMACMARLTSAPLDPDMVASELTVVWYQDAFTAPLPEEIERVAAALQWERTASDVDLP